jgi:hypothetical protein
MRSILFCLMAFLVYNIELKAQNCALTLGTTTKLSDDGTTCQYESVINFSATNTNNAQSITISTSNGSISLVTNPAGQQDALQPFTFTSNFNGAYTIRYYVPCNQTNILFTFTYDGPGSGDCSISSPLIQFAPLPVTLAEYNYKKKGNEVVLYWTTVTEKNNQGFVIEKSKDSYLFNQITFIQSKKRDDITTYETNVDANYYYRLTQIDVDGRETKLGILYADIDKNIIIRSNQQRVEISNNLGETISVLLINLQGQIIVQEEFYADTASIDISTLPQGLYFVKTIVGDEIQSTPIVKY